ncbi:autoinducer binding domain-containing protein [Frigidibacter sp. ROC022]|uniref:autoinducer binding domain-containing protein n=1 Tax=Frigidibacter sp. ROC022 TaxID=2971796 RepID=UPI00215B2C01|nr:autoinducer binding domain-containing protein [Frigidibacter sp. ROC022]MCR8725271.1 autoinducer binding domain-containing protein [Frigidibacter sp. ROC022]
MKNKATIAELIGLLHQESPAGFAIALHIRFSAPTFLFQSYPVAWSEEYTNKGLLMKDPTVAWGLTQTGAVRWSDLAEKDTAGVFEGARAHGLNYGVTIAISSGGLRSVASFVRSDREFTDEEIAAIRPLLAELHALTEGTDALSDEDREALTEMSIRMTHS